MNIMTLNKSDGTTEEVELIARFKLDKFEHDYIFYRLNDEHYAAKFIENENDTMLITSFTKEETKALTKIYESLVKGGRL